jgi:hypothetical protein
VGCDKFSTIDSRTYFPIVDLGDALLAERNVDEALAAPDATGVGSHDPDCRVHGQTTEGFCAVVREVIPIFGWLGIVSRITRLG